jgi:NTE family protein
MDQVANAAKSHYRQRIGNKASRKPLHKSHKLGRRPPFECIALLLQGGGALGAYQAGVYEALAESGLHPDRVAGISIGAINGAIIAGNAPDARVSRLRQFWREITCAHAFQGILPSESARTWINQLSALAALFGGTRGFFQPRPLLPDFYPPGSLEAISYYDTRYLQSTLERLIDFDRLNSGEMRVSFGAVNVRNGNFVYFDTETHILRPEHVMASGALPPGFPPIEIDGEYYWDGGLVSNTPLHWVTESGPPRDTLAFQVDLWSATGTVPRNMAEVITRQKEIQYSSRTRANTDFFRKVKRLRRAISKLLAQLPDELTAGDEATLLASVADDCAYNLVHLIYHPTQYEGHYKDFEFSRLSMEEHWRAGYHDAVRTLRHPEVFERDQHSGVFTFDLSTDGRE